MTHDDDDDDGVVQISRSFLSQYSKAYSLILVKDDDDDDDEGSTNRGIVGGSPSCFLLL